MRPIKNLWCKSRRASAIDAACRSIVEPLEGRTLLSASLARLAADLPSDKTAHHVRLHRESHKPHANNASTLGSHMFAHPMLDDLKPAGAKSGGSASPFVTNSTPSSWHLFDQASQVEQAYGFNNVLLPNGSPATGAGETIGIVDAIRRSRTSRATCTRSTRNTLAASIRALPRSISALWRIRIRPRSGSLRSHWMSNGRTPLHRRRPSSSWRRRQTVTRI